MGDQKKGGRGGARAGAGRKPTHETGTMVRLAVFLNPVVLARVRALAGERGETPGSIARELIEVGLTKTP